MTKLRGGKMDFTFETQGANTYLVYKMEQNENIDTMSLGMLTNNKIPGLATTLFTQMDTTQYIKFNVSARVSVKQFFSGPVNRKRLIGVFNGIVDAMISCEDYMINPNSILLDLDYIFADVSTCETVLICLPLEGYDNNVKLGEFFKGIMFNTQFDQTENCDHVAKIMNYLNSAPAFSLPDFKKVLEELEAPAAPAVKTVEVASTMEKGVADQPQIPVAAQPPVNVAPPAGQTPSCPVPNAAVAPENAAPAAQKEKKPGFFSKLFKKEPAKNKASKSKKNKKEKAPGVAPAYAVPGVPQPPVVIPGHPDPIKPMGQAPVKPAAPAQAPVGAPGAGTAPVAGSNANLQGHAANFGETTVLNVGNIGETTVLTAAQQPVRQDIPHLIRVKNNERISVNKPVFRIGKERSYVDYFIGDNTAISRSHASIVSRDGTYFLVDTNSTNHSFVDGQMIPSNVEVKIEHGTKIMLANEEFEFKLY